ncbi:MAG: TetR/AcrR family transcriptional regulator [Thermodesulfobacteriota bacterium]|nr:TetR/AcrR family transcriptional regulator [Thermodesulfobacteriota bacterium]
MGIMKREQHKARIKRKVLQAAKASFFEKGYARTPITEIMKKAGVANGTLYHFFKNKEDILLHLTREMFDMTIRVADGISKDTRNPWVNVYIETAMQFSLVLYHPHIAEMYLIAHESGLISAEITKRIHDRHAFLFQRVFKDIGDDALYTRTLAVKGLIHSFIQVAVHAENKPDPALAFPALEVMLTLLQIPENMRDETLSKARDLLRHHPGQFIGLVPDSGHAMPNRPIV